MSGIWVDANTSSGEVFVNTYSQAQGLKSIITEEGWEQVESYFNPNGGGGGGSDPEPDESTIRVSNDGVRSPNPSTIEADWSARNRVDSGDGQRLSDTIRFIIDGQVVGEKSVTLGPGESTSGTQRLSTSKSGQNVQVCVEGDCDRVQVPEVADDPAESLFEVSLVSLASPAPQALVVEYEATNAPQSGGGVPLSGTVKIDIDGEQRAQPRVELAPGQSTTATYEINGVSPGNHEVCVRV